MHNLWKLSTHTYIVIYLVLFIFIPESKVNSNHAAIHYWSRLKLNNVLKELCRSQLISFVKNLIGSNMYRNLVVAN